MYAYYDRFWSLKMITAMVVLISIGAVGFAVAVGGNDDDVVAVSETSAVAQAGPTEAPTPESAPTTSPTTQAPATQPPVPTTETSPTTTVDNDESSADESSADESSADESSADESSADENSTDETGTDDLGYPAAPDGTPLPALVVYAGDEIRLSGQVPTAEAKDRLGALALANSQTEASLVNDLEVNPNVPINVGVRVIELNSPRFADGDVTLTPEHQAQFDRVVNVLNALPNVSVLVIGHADQRGDEAANIRISDERARVVVNYLADAGIAVSRLASRAAGETELLTFEEDADSLALNRRTEFIFYGLLVE